MGCSPSRTGMSVKMTRLSWRGTALKAETVPRMGAAPPGPKKLNLPRFYVGPSAMSDTELCADTLRLGDRKRAQFRGDFDGLKFFYANRIPHGSERPTLQYP